MSAIAPFIFLGLLLAALLIIWANRSGRLPSLEASEVSDPGSALELLRFDLLPPATVGQLFSPDDWGFVHKATSRRIERLFVRERTALALFWLEETRRQMSGLMKLHRRAARSSGSIKPGAETRLAIRFAAFLIGCDFLYLAIVLWGPFRVRAAIARAASWARDLCANFERLFEPYQHRPANQRVLSQSRF